MKSNVFMGLLIMILILAGCNQSPKTDMNSVVNLEHVDETYESNAISEETDVTASNQESSALRNLKIIKNAQCRFKVKNVDSVTTLARTIIGKHDGYMSNMQFKNTLHELENRFTVRIPQQHFESVLRELTDLAEFVDFTNITTTDVSEEYIDLQTRLRTKLKVKARYDDILRSKAKTVEDILMAEEKLRILQEEIEAAQGRLKFLGNKVSLSTIQIDLYETVAHRKEPEIYTRTFISKVRESFVFGLDMIEGLFLALLHIWPLLLITTGVVFYIRYRKK
ncbi:DUF4349 domain-containing protein [Spongiimicrobium sp. 2-473A-2-J]|uniref:DUF4349 domain-containing protein n=1 Tax=Eudoraea algarum TaxID=3417568 RepID=UPI003D360B57